MRGRRSPFVRTFPHPIPSRTRTEQIPRLTHGWKLPGLWLRTHSRKLVRARATRGRAGTETGGTDRMAGRPYILAETPWKTVSNTRYEVAVLPWGATEAHNRHLPYGTDTYATEYVAAESARRAWEAGARVVVLPA